MAPNRFFRYLRSRLTSGNDRGTSLVEYTILWAMMGTSVVAGIETTAGEFDAKFNEASVGISHGAAAEDGDEAEEEAEEESDEEAEEDSASGGAEADDDAGGDPSGSGAAGGTTSSDSDNADSDNAADESDDEDGSTSGHDSSDDDESDDDESEDDDADNTDDESADADNAEEATVTVKQLSNRSANKAKIQLQFRDSDGKKIKDLTVTVRFTYADGSFEETIVETGSSGKVNVTRKKMTDEMWDVTATIESAVKDGVDYRPDEDTFVLT